MPAHGQKTRLLDRPGGWRRAWQVVVDPGTGLNTDERLSRKYTWNRNKWELRVAEVVDVGAAIITFDFKPVPKLTTKTMQNDLTILFAGYYTGDHAAPHAPKLQIYDYIAVGWVDLTGGALTAGRSVEELLVLTAPGSGDWWEAGTNNVRVRILHAPVAGDTTHRLVVNHMGLATAGIFTTTTSTTSTTSTTTT